MSDCRHDATKPFCDINVANINVKVRNARCENSYEAFMCKEVTIDLKLQGGKAEIILMQQKVTAKLNDAVLHTFEKGNYPQPLTPVDGMEGVQIFKVNINPFHPIFQPISYGKIYVLVSLIDYIDLQ